MKIKNFFHKALLTGCLSAIAIPAFAEDGNKTESNWLSKMVVVIVLAVIAYWLYLQSKKMNATITPPPTTTTPHGAAPHGTPPATATTTGGAHPPAATPAHEHHEQNPARFWTIVIIALAGALMALDTCHQTVLPVANENVKMWSDEKLGTHLTQQAKDAYSEHREKMKKLDYNGAMEKTVTITDQGYEIQVTKNQRFDWSITGTKYNICISNRDGSNREMYSNLDVKTIDREGNLLYIFSTPKGITATLTYSVVTKH